MRSEMGNHRTESKRLRFPGQQTKGLKGLVNPIGIRMLWGGTKEKETEGEAEEAADV
jgi:hypothetical protein